MKLKLHAMIFVMIGFVLLVFGARSIFTQYTFAQNAEVVQGTILGSSSKRGAVVSYVQDGVTKTGRLKMLLFSNAFEFEQGEEVTLRVSLNGTQDPEAYRGVQDVIMSYTTGVFLVLIGCFFVMIGLLIQKFGKE